MEKGSSAMSKKSTRPKWLKPGEVWGGDNEDNPEIGNTVGLRIKRWYRGLPVPDERQEPRCNRFGAKITLRKLALALLATLMAFFFMYLVLPHAGVRTKKFGFARLSPTSCLVCSCDKTAITPVPAFQSPELSDYRTPDSLDTFKDYKFHNHTDCQISSLDLHASFAPLCTARADMLDAISSGGRIGFGAPFMPRGCDMRWFTTEEVCEIFSRFDKVIVVGDSMMRHVVGALNVLLRKNLGYGAVTNWNFSPKEKRECFCNKQFNVKDCSEQGIYRTSDVRAHDRDSFACTQPDVDLTIEMMLKFPLDPVEVARFKRLLAPSKPAKPYAFIFGHGLWDDLDLHATLNWLDGILAYTKEAAPYLGEKGAIWPRLIVTPNAVGTLKPDQWVQQSQGDKALQIFEHSVRIEAAESGVEHLGTWNMSIQTEKVDGVHLDLKGNLVKAMAVMNWLALVDTE